MDNLNVKISTLPILEIKNTYIFELIDNKNEIIDTQVYNNITMPKRYFQKNVDNLNLRLGTMLPKDYAKYQSGGKWKKGWAAHYEDGAMVTSDSDDYDINRKNQIEIEDPNNPNGTITIDTTPYYVFNGQVTENDTELWGTNVRDFSFDWHCHSISIGEVTLKSSTEWGYHNIEHPLNQKISMGNNKDVGAGERGNLLSGLDKVDPYSSGTGKTNSVEDPVYFRSDPITDLQSIINGEVAYSDYQVTSYPMEIIGIKITDAGYFNSNAGLLSHFSCNIIKRPVEKLRISVIANFKILNLNFGLPFLKEGNIAYAHNLGSKNTGTVKYKPTILALSSYPIVNSANNSGEIIPIASNGPSYYLNTVNTDKPNDWVDEEKGEWFGFPQYSYYGNGNYYQTLTEQVESGTDSEGNPIYKDREVEVLNDSGQRSFEWDKINEKTVVNLEQSSFGPVRSVVLSGYSATADDKVLSQLIPGEVTTIKIGTGNNSRTRFYHPFTTEIGKVIKGYSKGTKNIEADFISESYDISKNPFSTLEGFQGVYGTNSTYYPDEYGKKICDKNDINKITKYNYHKEDKYCNFSKHPFLDVYFPCGDRITCGRYGLVYQYNGTITKGWVGLTTGMYVNTSLVIATAPTIEELFYSSNERKMVSVAPSTSQHNESTLNLISKGYVLIQGGADWVLGGYMGGLSYQAFDQAGVRLTTEETITGYIEFSEPPPVGSTIYVDAIITVPFLHYFNNYSGKVVIEYGTTDDNGTEV